MNMPKAEDEDVVNNNLPVNISHKLLPEGSDTANYTGVTHFHRIKDPNLITNNNCCSRRQVVMMEARILF